MQLAIDTSTSVASVAMARRGEVVAEITWHTEQNHSVELLPNIIYLLQQAKADLSSLDGIVVAKGPGSYNGLRVGVSTAKGLALALGLPLVGVGTLEVEAYPFALTGLPVYPLQGAGRGEVATALYQRRRGKWLQLQPEHLTTLEELSGEVRRRALFCGEISSGSASLLLEKLGRKAVVASGGASLRRAGYLAELGWLRLEQGEVDNLATLQPIYLRRPPITQPKPRPSLSSLVGRLI